MKKACGVLALLVGLNTGCMTGFHRDALTAKFAVPGMSSDEEIAKVQGLRAQTRFPCKVAVYLSSDGEFRWTKRDKEILQQVCEPLVKDGVISELIFINDLFANNTSSLKELRLAAAKYGADTLLTVRGVTEVDEYINPAALLNVTLVGAYVAPGHHRDALFMVRGALMDVNNALLFATAESEAVGKSIRPYFFADRKVAIDTAKEKALSDFAGEITQRLRLAAKEYDKSKPIVPDVAPAKAVETKPAPIENLLKAEIR